MELYSLVSRIMTKVLQKEYETLDTYIAYFKVCPTEWLKAKVLESMAVCLILKAVEAL